MRAMTFDRRPRRQDSPTWIAVTLMLLSTAFTGIGLLEDSPLFTQMKLDYLRVLARLSKVIE